MEAKQVVDDFANSLSCSQIVLMHFAERAGMDMATACRVSAVFGSGFGCGEACGAVVGALMAIGLLYGPDEGGIPEQKAKVVAIRNRFLEEFNKQFKGPTCREVMGLDFGKPEEAAEIREKGLINIVCPDAVIAAIDILEKMIAEYDI